MHTLVNHYSSVWTNTRHTIYYFNKIMKPGGKSVIRFFLLYFVVDRCAEGCLHGTIDNNNNNIYLKPNIQCTKRYEFSGLLYQ